MSRGLDSDHADVRALRCAVVWLLATAATTATWWLMAPAGAALMTAAGWSGTFDALLVRLCAAALLPSTAWLWIVTTVTVVGLVRGRPLRGGAVRQLVLLACGVALSAGVASPATAADPAIEGLAMPDRAVAVSSPAHAAPHAPARTPAAPAEHVVVPGDSLWAIAASQHDSDWQAIWAANRSVIGDDPDLILPGQRLTLPPTTPPSTTRDHRRAR